MNVPSPSPVQRDALEITSSIPGFVRMNGAELAEAMVAAGIMSREDADAALERRRRRRSLALTSGKTE